MLFWGAKRGVDIVLAALLLPVVAVLGVLLLILNPWMNRGPLFFVQVRMGRGCQPFRAVKFRTMTASDPTLRGPNGSLERHRITPLGGLLRRTRLDELPQVVNVLGGEMSLIGPRPDCLAHAEHFLQTVPGYRQRHVVRPGISGLAQTQIGYVEGEKATRRKVEADLLYIHNAGFRMEAWIFLRTLQVILRRQGN